MIGIKEKGIVITTTLLATMIFVVVSVMIVLLIYLSVTRDSPSAISDFFFRLLDFRAAFA